MYADVIPTEDVYTIQLDWAQITRDIKAAGVPYTQQAFALGKQFSTLQTWMQGGEPEFRNGCALLVLHRKVCGPQLTLKRLMEGKLIE